MAVEAKRGCGFRKVGGLYLVGEGFAVHCLKIPCNVELCPTCGQGIKFARGFTWINAKILLKGDCVSSGLATTRPEHCQRIETAAKALHLEACPFDTERAGLMWVGSGFYTPQSFIEEAARLGVSKRITSIPNEFVVGRDWVLLGHKKAGTKKDWVKVRKGDVLPLTTLIRRPMEAEGADIFALKDVTCPAIFYAFRPTKVEKIVTASMLRDMSERQQKKDAKEGIVYVMVPEDDPDHQGSAYDKQEGPKDAFDKAVDDLEEMNREGLIDKPEDDPENYYEGDKESPEDQEPADPDPGKLAEEAAEREYAGSQRKEQDDKDYENYVEAVRKADAEKKVE